jgi:hypothetical protein
MKTFYDAQKLINIRMLTIYFMLSEDERAEHNEMIARLNRIKAFTLGLYEFKILTKLGGVNSCLYDDLKGEVEANNLIVRLPNDTQDNFVYAFDAIDLSADVDVVEKRIHNFVIELAEHSIAILKERQSSNAGDAAQLDNVIYSYEAAIKSGKLSYTRQTAPKVVRECHEDYCDVPAGRVFTTAFCTTGIKGVLNRDDADLERLYGCLGKHGIPESKQKMVASELAEIFADMFGIPSKEESAEIAEGILDKRSNAIAINKCGRQKPAVKPNIKIYIERIPYVDGRGKKRRERYGVRISVGSFEQKILFEDATQTMMYTATLLRHKMGGRLYIHELRNNSYGTNAAREMAKHWLKKIYTTIISPEKEAFDKWIESIRNPQNMGKKLTTAVSSTRRVVPNGLVMYPDAIYYSLIVSGNDAEKGGYYTINCSPDDIIVCGELQEMMQGTPGAF